MTARERAALIADLQRLWGGWSDLRFGQLLRVAVHDPATRTPRALDDPAIAAGVRAALDNEPGSPPAPGPYWDTEASRGRTFLNGMPRDPARIPRVLAALAGAWETDPAASLGQTVDEALDRARIRENDFNSRLLLIEDGPLRRALDGLRAHRGLA